MLSDFHSTQGVGKSGNYAFFEMNVNTGFTNVIPWVLVIKDL